MAKKRKSETAGLDEVERSLYKSFCLAANSISQLYTQSQNHQKSAFQAGERHCAERLCQWLQRDYNAGSNISVNDILSYLQNEMDGEEMTMSPGPQFQHLSTQQHQQHPYQQQPQQQPQHQPQPQPQSQSQPQPQPQHQHLQQQQQQQSQLMAPNNQGTTAGYAGRIGTGVDQTKISVFTGALSSPNRRLLPHFPLVHSRRSGGGTDLHEVQEIQESPASTQAQAYSAPSHPSQTQSVAAVYGYNSSQGQHRESNTFAENDFSMDMHADGGSDEYYR